MASGTIALAVAIMMGLCVAGTAISQAIVASKTMDSMARQPEIAGKLQTAMILAMALQEALTIYGLLIAFMLVGKI